jgi:hypothetical protein
MTAGVEVSEAVIWATQRGADWWTDFRRRYEPAGRVTVVTPSVGGDLVRVACDDAEDAAWLRGHMLAEGIPARAVRTLRGAPAVARGDAR